jgi:2-C-methyl-D-erythritol 2,4-cyclodiphosphate synthase
MDYRIGHGYDLHRLREGGKLLLAGVVVSHEMSAIAHSDGDVILHAVVDAMLGAIGGEDIGEHFPDTDARWKDAPSSVFVQLAVDEVEKAGYEIANVDVTLIAERPRIKAIRSIMVDSLRQLLGQSQLPVNVKAGTNEGCDAIGRGEAIAAHVVVLLRTAQSAP